MAASVLASEQAQEVFSWLRALPLAPEYHPTLAEFQDPISYIFKIEKEASKYGICKIVPPVLPSPKKTVISNLNRSLAARAAVSEGNCSESRPVFTTRQQQIGFCPRKSRPVQKPVWQSGEHYTFQQFEAKAKSFEKSYLKKCAKKGGLSALEIESLYWKATVDKPFSVEYANDMPGSAFVPFVAGKCKDAGEGVTLGETAWNMRGVSRSKGSLLRFMKEEIHGVTSPMVYIAMMFSWFAWHVEDHDLHSLNYLHMGAAKTWYGVPREASVAFEEVVRVHGYGGEINPLVTFAVLGEKTTVLSPEVFVGAGVPCCRLVQNPGEFVVTFPRAYHTGFSHGFNCGEAANIATPEWLNIATDAAIRRASINYPPMLSHFQLLYDLALALCSRIHIGIDEPRSSRLKVKKKSGGETMIKELFVQNVVHNNKLLQILGRGSSVVFLPQNCSDVSGSKLHVGFPPRINPRLALGFCSSEGFSKYPKGFDRRYLKPDHIQEMDQVTGFCSIKRTSSFSYNRSKINSPEACENDNIYSSNSKSEGEITIQGDGLSDQRLFSCVTCGILCFSCAAIIQPTESSANYLMSADCSFLNDWLAGSRATSGNFVRHALTNGKNIYSDDHRMGKRVPDGLYEVHVQSVDYHDDIKDHSYEAISDSEPKKNTSALGLLALTYGNISDSEEDRVEPDVKSCSSEHNYQPEITSLPSTELCKDGSNFPHNLSSSRLNIDGESTCERVNSKDKTFDCTIEYSTNEISFQKANFLDGRFRESRIASSRPIQTGVADDRDGKFGNETMSFVRKSDEDSSRLHVFCLEHAIQVEKQLQEIGGVHILLYCHPEYSKIEGEAKALAEEMGMDYTWNRIEFREASKDDEDRILSAFDGEEATPGNGDWAVKLGINLFYSASLCRSPLYSKQMPYNSVIYRAFGRSSSTKPRLTKKRSTRIRNEFVGKWCGKVWMSNQIHPLLKKQENEEKDDEDDKPVVRKSSNVGKSEATIIARKTSSKRKSRSGLSKNDYEGEDDDSGFNVWDVPAERKSRGSRNGGRERKSGSGGRSVKKTRADVVSDDLIEDLRRQRRRILRSKTLIERDSDNLSEENSDNFGSENVSSEDSLMDHRSHRSKIRLGSKKSKSTEVKNAFSDDFSEDDSNQAKNIERDESPSDESRANYSPRNDLNISGKRQDVHSNEVEDTFLKYRRRSSRTKQIQCVAKKNEFSDNSLRHTKSRSKRHEILEKDGADCKQVIPVPVKRRSRESTKQKSRLEASKNSRRRSDSDTDEAVKGRSSKKIRKTSEGKYVCDIEGCSMSYSTKQELMLHKRNICPVKGCGKKFFSHKYLVQHRRVHVDDRPLKCPWKGCKMSFKWAWARTEHIRVHTGARPYVCKESGCGKTFRFVSDFSRHKRKTGHLGKKGKG